MAQAHLTAVVEDIVTVVGLTHGVCPGPEVLADLGFAGLLLTVLSVTSSAGGVRSASPAGDGGDMSLKSDDVVLLCWTSR